MQALVCTDRIPPSPPPPTQTHLSGAERSVLRVRWHELTSEHDVALTPETVAASLRDHKLKIFRVVESQGSSALSRLTATASDTDGNHYYVYDSDDNPKNDIPTMKGIDDLRQRCADFGLRAVRVTSAKQIDEVIRPMLQKAGYNLRRGSGVPLGFDYSASNTYEALDDAGVRITHIFADLHSKFGYKGDHTTNQLGDRQHLAGLGWARSEKDVGIEDWGTLHCEPAEPAVW